MVGVVFVVTDDVLIGKLPAVAPPEMIALTGGAATPKLLLLMVTGIPPLGDGPVSVIVPVELVPPTTLVGDKVSDITVGAFKVRVTVLVPL
jgi:hypothetical protein